MKIRWPLGEYATADAMPGSGTRSFESNVPTYEAPSRPPAMKR